MLLKVVLALTALAVVTANPVVQRSFPYEMVSVIALERECVLQGGLCLRVEDCDPSNLVKVNAVLCPKQQHLGVECCYN